MNVLLVDDHAILLDGMKSLLTSMDGYNVVGTATTVEAALNSFEQLQPDLVISDYSLPDGNGAQLAKQLRFQSDEVKIMVLSMHSEVHIVNCLLYTSDAADD